MIDVEQKVFISSLRRLGSDQSPTKKVGGSLSARAQRHRIVFLAGRHLGLYTKAHRRVARQSFAAGLCVRGTRSAQYPCMAWPIPALVVMGW